MNTKLIIVSLLTVMTVFFWDISPVDASSNRTIEDSIDITNYLSRDNNSIADEYNYTLFEAYATEEGEFYAEFWLLPARYSDGKYTQFVVYVNDVFAGKISPNKENWQAARIEGNQKIQLKKGINTIKIGVRTPETPAVETIRLAINDAEAKIASNLYVDFLNNAISGLSNSISEQNTPTQDFTFDNESINASEISMKHFTDIPLKYTFFNQFRFKKGEIVHVASSSASEHDVDIIYLGLDILQTGGLNSERDLSSPSSATEVGISDDISSPIDTIKKLAPGILKTKYTLVKHEATSEELQGLNWKGLSFKSEVGETNEISKFIKIPKSGAYLIRLRHRESGKTGIANITVNDEYSYLNVPISFTWVPCVIPANGKEYGTMTCCNDVKKDDPVLFIHGAAADRIVGYSDDAKKDFRDIHNLAVYDSHIIQEYLVPISGLSVSNYSSLDPESTCEIIAGVDESQFIVNPNSQGFPQKIRASNSLESPMEEKVDIVTWSFENDGSFTIASQSKIRDLIIRDVSGRILTHITPQESHLSIPPSNFSMLRKAGILIISVETEAGAVSKKIMIE